MSQHLDYHLITEDQREELKNLILNRKPSQLIYPFSNKLIPFLTLQELDDLSKFFDSEVELYAMPQNLPQSLDPLKEIGITDERIKYESFGLTGCEVSYHIVGRKIYDMFRADFDAEYNNIGRKTRCLVQAENGNYRRCTRKKCDPSCKYYPFRDQLSKREIPLDNLEDAIPSNSPLLEETIESREMAQYIENAVKKKNPQYFEVFLDYYYLGLSVDEIQEKYNMKESTFRYALSQVKKWIVAAKDAYERQ